MVDSSAVMGHDALQRPSWPQAQRSARHRQHDGSQADKVKDYKRRQGRGLPHGPHLVMLFSVSAVMAQHRLGSPEKARRLSKKLSFACSFFQLQRLSAERTQVRHRLSDAEQSSVIPAVRRPDQSDTISSFILDTALRQSISSKHQGTEVEEGEQPKATDVEPEPEGHDEAQAESEVKKDKRLKSENTKSKSLASNPKAARELARVELQKGYFQSTSGRNSCTPASWYQASTTHGTSTWVP